MKHFLFLTIFILAVYSSATSQNTLQFTQSVNTQKILNPAYHRTGENTSFFILNRTQWIGFDGAPQVLVFNMQMPVKKKNIGFGATLSTNGWAFFRQSNLMGSFTYTIESRWHKLSFGIQGGINNYKIIEGDVIAKSTDIGKVNAYAPNLGVGLFYSTKELNIGLSLPQIFSMSGDGSIPLEFGNTLALKNIPVFLFSTYRYKLAESITLKPSLFVRYMPQYLTQADMILNLILKNRVSLGAGYRTADALLLYAGFRFNSNFDLSISYDITTSALSNVSNGTAEVSILFNLAKRKGIIHEIPIE